MSGFYELGPLEEVAVNLFYGWGYNFYRLENQMRADDQRVRELAGTLLGQARQSLNAIESAYRRENIPTPTREKPFPPPEAVAAAQKLERLAGAIGALEGQIRHQPVPENDRMTQRYRSEAGTLDRLIQMDKQLIGRADLLREYLQGSTPQAVLERFAELEGGVSAMTESLRQRQRLLLS